MAMLLGADPCRTFYYGYVLRQVFDRVSVVCLTQSDAQNEYRDALARVTSLAGSAFLFVTVVRFVFFKVYVILEAGLQLTTILCQTLDLKPIQALLTNVERMQESLQSRPFPYCYPIVLNLVLNFGACFCAELRGLSKPFSFICELAVSAVNAMELQSILLGDEDGGWKSKAGRPQKTHWSHPMTVLCQIVAVALLEFASWDPWSALLGFGPSDEDPISALWYFVCGAVGLALFYVAEAWDNAEPAEEKQRRMEKDSMYQKLEACYKQVRENLPQAATAENPEARPSNSPDLDDVSRAWILAAKFVAPSFGPLGTALSLAWDMRSVAMTVRDAAIRDRQAPTPTKIFENNTVNLIAFAMNKREWFDHGELATQAILVVFLWCNGFADELVVIWSGLHELFQNLFLLIGVLSGVVCLIYKAETWVRPAPRAGTEDEGSMDKAWTEVDKQNEFVILAAGPSGPELFLAVEGDTNSECVSLQVSSESGGVPQDATWKLIARDEHVFIQHVAIGRRLVVRDGIAGLSDDPGDAGLWQRVPFVHQEKSGFAYALDAGYAMSSRIVRLAAESVPAPIVTSMRTVAGMFSGEAQGVDDRRSWTLLINKEMTPLRLPRPPGSMADARDDADIVHWRIKPYAADIGAF